MADRVTIVCPHCGSTDSYEVRMSLGQASEECRSCYKRFWVRYRNGKVEKVER